MDRRVSTILLGVIAAVVIVFAAYWVVMDLRDRRAAGAAAEQALREEVDRNSARMAAECRQQIADWDAGRRAPLQEEFGRFAGDVVDDCRRLLRFWEAQIVSP